VTDGIKVLIADDHTLVREGLKQIITESSGISVAGEAGSGEEALALIAGNDVDLLLLDISMPGRSGLDIMKQLKQMKPDLPVLILSMHPEEQYAVRALKAGAAGYLTKDSASEELISAILKISSGQKYISESLAETMAAFLSVEGEKLPHEFLSDREFEVMHLIVTGLSNKEIAFKLSLSSKTVSTYRTRILEKMDMASNAELTQYAIHHNLIS
jgi:DNA-binding NarL/FixJ family response regulator